ncbi:capsule biosynthesis protein [Pseudogemmobacter bohemicus]|uniref:capsule biosynthesis protein n=1 Tax=Pseudogemmobacter bohemicus TaxID=2250708 RepID=UPI000DD4DD95|nr:capsule biosynthesis protein [Pseudogemmobacter bohemicus]
MTMLKAARFNIRRQDIPAAAAPRPGPVLVPKPAPGEMLFDNPEDGFGDQKFETAGGPVGSAALKSAIADSGAAKRPADAEGGDAGVDENDPVAKELAAIRKEGLTGRQLRTARRLAQSHNMPATSDYDAVRLLRAAGINPFERGSMLDLVAAEPGTGTGTGLATAADGGGGGGKAGTGRALSPLPGDGVKLPQTVKPIQVPSTEQRVEVNHAAEILRMQQDIAKRRRRKLALLFVRMFIFVLLPTLIAGWYFSSVATRQYGTKSEFAVHKAESPQAGGALGGMLQGTSLATSQDSIAVQGYLQSREAMMRLEDDIGFRAAFMGDAIDPILRLPPEASLEDAYKLYKSHILISYDPSEGIIRMEAISPDAQLSVDWSKQLIGYAEEQVDQLTYRLREDAMAGADESYQDAETALLAAQEKVITLQEQFKVLNSETELTLLTSQIGTLDSQLIQERLALAQMEANANPNAARLEPVKRRIATLEAEIAMLRTKLTEGQGGEISLAQIQGQLRLAQADVETRQMMLAQSLQAKETARMAANSQTRYLSISVEPVPPDVPTYPRVFENTLVTLLILIGIYLMISMTVAILREQVSS